MFSEEGFPTIALDAGVASKSWLKENNVGVKQGLIGAEFDILKFVTRQFEGNSKYPTLSHSLCEALRDLYVKSDI